MDNRETATLIWLGIVLAVVLLLMPSVRSVLWESVRLFVQPAMFGPVIALAGWTVGLVVLGDMVGLWEDDLRSDTVVWFLTVGMAFYFSLDRVKEYGFLRGVGSRALAATAFVEVFVNLVQFSLAVELVLVPLVTFLVLLLAVSEGSPEYATTYRLLNKTLELLGFFLFAYVAAQLLTDFDAAGTARAFIWPLWLTFGAMPLIYGVGLWSAYQGAFGRIDLRTADDPEKRRRAKRALLRAAHVRAVQVRGFSGHWIWDLTSADSAAEARAVMHRWRTEWRSEQYAGRLNTARSSMRAWLEEAESTRGEIHAAALRRSWERLDGEQRATLKGEGLQLARRRALADALRALPD